MTQGEAFFIFIGCNQLHLITVLSTILLLVLTMAVSALFNTFLIFVYRKGDYIQSCI